MKPTVSLLFFLLLLSLSVLGQMQILNRSFELAIIPEPNKPPVYPSCWEHENYAGIHHDFYPEPERPRVINWSIPVPDEGDYFLVIHTGGYGEKSDASVSIAL